LSILAEKELLTLLLAQGIADETFVAIRAEIEAKVLARLLDILIFRAIFHVAQELTHFFHVVFIQVGFRDLAGVLGGEGFNFYDKTLIVSGPNFFTAEITREVHHGQESSIRAIRYMQGVACPGYNIPKIQPTTIFFANVPLFHPSQVSALLSS
jgi:hypothetical protein